MPRNYDIHSLDDQEFENLVSLFCVNMLGAGFTNFAPGKDGGRDGRFCGTANDFPSSAGPYVGKFIVQAKFTSNPVASCSDSDFLSIVKKEIPKIKKLQDDSELEHYLLFTNRKKPAGSETKINTEILSKVPGITVDLIGLERISLFLDSNAGVVKTCGLDKYKTPITIFSEDLKNVVTGFKTVWTRVVDEKEKELRRKDFTYIKIEEKNLKNKVTDAYFKHMQEESEHYFQQIKDFLIDPINEELAEIYYSTAAEFKGQLAMFKDQFESFDSVLEYIYQSGMVDELLRKNKGLFRIFIHFMYCNCDVGEK